MQMAKKKGCGCLPLLLLAGGGVICILLAIVIFQPKGNTPANDEAPPPSDHEISLKQPRGDGKLNIEVLVNEKMPKQEVLRIAERLQREYAGKYVTICIFDSREASQRRTDLSYPEKELSRHWLVVVDWGGDTGGKEGIRWVAQGRDH
jgi:hypothetical protein